MTCVGHAVNRRLKPEAVHRADLSLRPGARVRRFPRHTSTGRAVDQLAGRHVRYDALQFITWYG